MLDKPLLLLTLLTLAPRVLWAQSSAPDTPESGSVEEIARATTEARFLSPWVAYLPASASVMSPRAFLQDRKSTRLNSSHLVISYAVFCLKKKTAQRESPVDTKIEVLHADGKPVERLRLQALRNTAINFRSIDSNGNGARLDNYEEMELNEYIYFNGEVVRLFRMPQGPDSDMLFYSSNGKRRAYFDTSAMAHALDEPAYVVEPHLPGAELVSNGLPVIPLYYANDDDGERKLGADSKLFFTAPADGTYLIRVTDTRGYSGERFVYRLIVREPKPDFKVTLNGANPSINVFFFLKFPAPPEPTLFPDGALSG